MGIRKYKTAIWGNSSLGQLQSSAGASLVALLANGLQHLVRVVRSKATSALVGQKKTFTFIQSFSFSAPTLAAYSDNFFFSQQRFFQQRLFLNSDNFFSMALFFFDSAFSTSGFFPFEGGGGCLQFNSVAFSTHSFFRHRFLAAFLFSTTLIFAFDIAVCPQPAALIHRCHSFHRLHSFRNISFRAGGDGNRTLQPPRGVPWEPSLDGGQPLSVRRASSKDVPSSDGSFFLY